jgi:hypothetical protein
MAQNFAPGTTAADIESAMTPVGGIITSCRLIKQHPIVIAEIVFESKEGADNVIATFNKQTVWCPPPFFFSVHQTDTTTGRRPRLKRVPQSRQHAISSSRGPPRVR